MMLFCPPSMNNCSSSISNNVFVDWFQTFLLRQKHPSVLSEPAAPLALAQQEDTTIVTTHVLYNDSDDVQKTKGNSPGKQASPTSATDIYFPPTPTIEQQDSQDLPAAPFVNQVSKAVSKGKDDNDIAIDEQLSSPSLAATYMSEPAAAVVQNKRASSRKRTSPKQDASSCNQAMPAAAFFM